MKVAEMYRRRVMQFSRLVAKVTQDVVSLPVEGEGTIEFLRVVFYAGAEWTTEVRVTVEDGSGQPRSIVTYAPTAVQALVGESEEITLHPREPVSLDAGDIIKVRVNNTDAVNDHRVNVHMEVDYAGGKFPAGVGL